MVTRREVYLISLEDNKKSKKLFSLISLAISFALLILLFVPNITVAGFGVGSIIGGSKYSNIHNLICTILSAVIIGRVVLAALSLLLVKMEMPEKREKDIFTVTIVTCVIHFVVYVAMVVFSIIYINTQLAYFAADTTWLKIACILAFFPHGIIKAIIKYWIFTKSEKQVVETSASTFNARSKRYLFWKFVPTILAGVLIMVMLPSISEDTYPHYKAYPTIKNDADYSIGHNLTFAKFKFVVDGEEYSFDETKDHQVNFVLGGNAQLYTDMIAEREAKLENATGNAKKQLEDEIKKIQEAAANVIPSYEVFTYQKSEDGKKVSISSYFYDANPANGEISLEKVAEDKVSKPALNFIEDSMYEFSVKLAKPEFSISKKKAPDFTTEKIIATVTYKDGSISVGYITPDNAAELNAEAKAMQDKKIASEMPGEKDLILKWHDAWGEYQTTITIK